METLPLLLFPTPRQAKPESTNFSKSKPRLPSQGRQVERLDPKFAKFQRDFFADHAALKSTLAGYEPEFVLVIETADRLDKFKRAIDKTEGLEWLSEWDDDIDADDDFYHLPTIGVDFFKGKLKGIDKRAESSEIQNLLSDQGFLDLKNVFLDKDLSDLELPQHLEPCRSEIEQAIVKAKRKPLNGRLYLSMSSQKGLEELTSLWTKWKETGDLPYGKGKWKEVFGQITNIRRWGIQEQLIETGVKEEWKESLEQDDTAPVNFQIELFYRTLKQLRDENESALLQIIGQLGGSLISNFIDIPEIRFHGVKAELPASGVAEILRDIENESSELVILRFSGIMYYRPTGQSFTSSSTESFDVQLSPPTDPVSGDPVVAILDGVPFSEHSWLKGRLLLDDADNLESEYQPGERKHGTAMASLVLHGELDKNETPLNRPVYFRPIMQPNASGGWSPDFFEEHIPQDVFFEDRIWRAVRRMFEGEGATPPQAPSVRVINLSIGDRAHQFGFSLSPCAKLLDWLSWKYNVLFCVSIGNHKTSLDLGLNETEFKNTKEQERIGLTLSEINRQVSIRRLLSPSESLNSISVGSLHCDESSITALPHHVDVLPKPNMPSPLNSLGYGFRRSIKPEILFPGGKQLYKLPLLPGSTSFEWSPTVKGPGQKVATESSTSGSLNQTIYTRGSSNATALATRSAAQINEVIEDIMAQNVGKLPETHIPVIIKTLLTHGAIKGESMEELKYYLTPLAPPRKAKEFISKFTGYGAVDIERVLYCTEQRATIVGAGTIEQKTIHEYRLPLPPSLANEMEWRRLIITLGWFTPINPGHRYLRQAALSFAPPKKDEPLLLERSELDPHQVKRGTLQHEILQSQKVSDYQDGDFLVIPVQCRADATDSLDDHINYALAVTLEVKEGLKIPIYQEIQDKIRPRPPIPINRGK
jgi:hypothetical protein